MTVTSSAPVVRMPVKILNSPNDDNIILYGVVNTIRKPVQEVTANVAFDYAPDNWILENDVDRVFHRVDERSTNSDASPIRRE